MHRLFQISSSRIEMLFELMVCTVWVSLFSGFCCSSPHLRYFVVAQYDASSPYCVVFVVRAVLCFVRRPLLQWLLLCFLRTSLVRLFFFDVNGCCFAVAFFVVLIARSLRLCRVLFCVLSDVCARLFCVLSPLIFLDRCFVFSASSQRCRKHLTISSRRAITLRRH